MSFTGVLGWNYCHFGGMWSISCTMKRPWNDHELTVKRPWKKGKNTSARPCKYFQCTLWVISVFFHYILRKMQRFHLLLKKKTLKYVFHLKILKKCEENKTKRDTLKLWRILSLNLYNKVSYREYRVGPRQMFRL